MRTKWHVLSLLMGTLLIIVGTGCGSKWAAVQTPTRAIFKPTSTTSNPNNRPDDEYVINFNSDIDKIQAPANTKVPSESSKSSLHEHIQNVKIERLPELNYHLTFRIKIQNQGQVQPIIFERKQSIRIKEIFEMRSADNLFSLQAYCLTTNCDLAWLLFTDLQKKESAEIRYERKTEFFKKSDKVPFTGSDEDSQVLKEAVEYGYPVIRHSMRVTDGPESNILIVERPAIETNVEDFTTEGDDDTPLADYVSEPESSSIYQARVVELESTSGVTLRPYTSSPNPPAKPQPSSPEKPQTSPQKTVVPTNESYLTSNPLEAYAYQIHVPEKLLNSTDMVRDAFYLPISFTPTPIQSQQEFEPSYRMTVFAQAAVNQKVRVLDNACNIFARWVMTLAGYTGGSAFLANDFEKVFQDPSQGLNHWAIAKFDYNKNISTEVARLTEYLDQIPAGYSLIAQFDRSSKNRRGHVAIVSRLLDNRLVVYDASYRQYGPRRTAVAPRNLLTKSRFNLRLFSLPKLITPTSIQM